MIMSLRQNPSQQNDKSDWKHEAVLMDKVRERQGEDI